MKKDAELSLTIGVADSDENNFFNMLQEGTKAVYMRITN